MGKSRRLIYALVGVLIVCLVVLVVACLLHYCGRRRGAKRPKEQLVERTFHVSMLGTRHGATDAPVQLHYVVDGELHATLRLKRGKRYRLVLDQGTHPMYITSSSLGGPGVPGSIDPKVDERGIVEEGSDMYIVIDKAMQPGTLYYQSTVATGVGGAIVVE